jgi:hypothetical protein
MPMLIVTGRPIILKLFTDRAVASAIGKLYLMGWW